MKITAAVIEETSGPFVIQELELGALAPDEVLVEVAAAGICHTDLIVRDQWLPTPLPAVLGHEGAGVVSAVGSAVTNVAPGDRVGMSFNSCGHCVTCLEAQSTYCHDFFGRNFAAARPDGSSVLVPRRRPRARPLLRAVQLRHACRRDGAQRRQAPRLDSASTSRHRSGAGSRPAPARS